MLDENTAPVNMLKQQLRATGILAKDVLQQFSEIPRQAFVPEQFVDLAYADCTLALNHEQRMLQPKEQAKIVQALNIHPSDNILEIGTGTGYLTAILAKLGNYVHSYDIFLDFTEKAQQTLAEIHIDNVALITDDANQAWDKHSPYDVICCTAGLPLYPEHYKQGLAVGGRLFAIVGTAPSMQAMLITRIAEETWSEVILFETTVPEMINAPRPEPFNF